MCYLKCVNKKFNYVPDSLVAETEATINLLCYAFNKVIFSDLKKRCRSQEPNLKNIRKPYRFQNLD